MAEPKAAAARSGAGAAFDRSMDSSIDGIVTYEALVSVSDSVDTFKALWMTLGLEGRSSGTRETLRDSPSAERTMGLGTQDLLDSGPIAPSQMGVSIHPLPRLSIGPPASEEAEANVPDIVVTGLLGEGGMGRVLLARQRSLGRDVAVKTLRDDAKPGFAESLIAEGVITGILEHPNIVPVHALGLDARGRPLLVMKRLSGVAWSALIENPEHDAWQRLTTLPQERLRAHIEILMSVAQALAFAHSRGIVHRDVKPENVMLGEFGEVYLLDFGVAMRLRPDVQDAIPRRVVGTPAFMAPEMVETSLPIGAFTDVYLMGATLHLILTGRVRHEGSTIEAAMLSALQSEPFAYGDDVPAELADLCHAAMQRDVDSRLATAIVFRRRLGDYLAHEVSRSLSRAAHERLVELDQKALTDASSALRIGSECRFGFLLALREWPDSPEARLGLDGCLIRMINLELRSENVAAARALLAEVERPPTGLAQALESVEAIVAQRIRDAERLRALDAATDLAVASAARRRLMFGIAGLVVLVGGSIALLRAALGVVPSLAASTLVFGCIQFAMCGVIFVARESLLKNTVNRRLALLLLANGAMSFIHRIELLFNHGTVTQAFQADLVIATMSCIANALYVHHSWWRGTAMALIGVAVAAVYPGLAEFAFVTSIAAVSVNWAIGWQQRR